jgi:hypothetical protein
MPAGMCAPALLSCLTPSKRCRRAKNSQRLLCTGRRARAAHLCRRLNDRARERPLADQLVQGGRACQQRQLRPRP